MNALSLVCRVRLRGVGIRTVDTFMMPQKFNTTSQAGGVPCIRI